MAYVTANDLQQSFNRYRLVAHASRLIDTHADCSRVSKAIIRICDSVILSVSPHDKKKNG